MNKEKYNQIIDEAYKSFETCCIPGTGKKMSKAEFVYYIKTNKEFSERWGLKIEERELTKNQGWERYELLLESIPEKELIENYKDDNRAVWMGFRKFKLADANYICDLEGTPTKLITLTYNNEKIEVYE